MYRFPRLHVALEFCIPDKYLESHGDTLLPKTVVPQLMAFSYFGTSTAGFFQFTTL